MLGLYLEALENSSDEELFTQVYERCKRLVYHTAYKVVQDSYLAEDVLQEVFLQLAKNFTRVYRDDAHKMAAYLAICAKIVEFAITILYPLTLIRCAGRRAVIPISIVLIPGIAYHFITVS